MKDAPHGRRLLIAAALLASAAGLRGAMLPAHAEPQRPGSDRHSSARVEQPRDSSSGDRAQHAELAFRLFNAVAEGTGEPNVLISPVSASIALGMLQAGAAGQTHAEIARALGHGGAAPSQIDEAYARLSRSLAARAGVELRIANSLWAHEDIPFRAEYLRGIRENYDAEAASLDLSSDAAVQRINEWASRSTQGKLDAILDGPLSADVVLMLANAVYFRGDWRVPFDSLRTRVEPFHAASTTRSVPTMNREDQFRYLRGPGFQVVRLPYAGDEVAMWVMLPDSGRSLADMRPELTGSNWARWTSAARGMRLQVSLPRFTARSRTDLLPPLDALGVRQAFDPAQADLTRMLARGAGGRNAFVSSARQEAVIEVGETGTVAAAVTTIEVALTSAPPPAPHMRIDRPFLLVLQDDTTGAVLFMGGIGEP